MGLAESLNEMLDERDYVETYLADFLGVCGPFEIKGCEIWRSDVPGEVNFSRTFSLVTGN